MKTVFNKLHRWIDILVRNTCIILLATLSVIIILQVIFRYLFSNALEWPEEVARFLFIWVSFLGTALAAGEKGHLGVGFFVKKFPQPYSRIINFSVHSLVILFLLLSVFGSLKLVRLGLNSSLTIVPLSWGHAYIALPIGLGLTLIYYVKSMAEKVVD